jgi:hypothetical protein
MSDIPHFRYGTLRIIAEQGGMGVRERDIDLRYSIDGLSMQAEQTDDALLHGIQVADMFPEPSLSLV